MSEVFDFANTIWQAAAAGREVRFTATWRPSRLYVPECAGLAVLPINVTIVTGNRSLQLLIFIFLFVIIFKITSIYIYKYEAINVK